MKRNTLAKQIRVEVSQSKRVELAKYGRFVPEASFVEHWQKRWKAAKGGKIPMPDWESRAMLDLFMGPLVKLDPKFFYDLAEAITTYKKQAPPIDSLRLKLSNPNLWLVHPLPTPLELAKALNYTGNMDAFRALLRELKVPHRRDRVGAPKKTQKNKV